MARVSFFIDGFNFYHALDSDDQLRRFKWINLQKLAKQYLRQQDSLADIFYFTALATWNPDKARRHELFIRVQESLGVKPIYGEFRNITRQCQKCGQSYDTFEEKETDVNIAIKLFEQASQNTFDNAIILSGDSDQTPAIKATKKNFPNKRIGVLVPPGRKAKLLRRIADFHFKIGYRQLADSRLPDMYQANGLKIYCPQPWK